MYRDHIRKYYDDLSPSFRVLADFLLDHTYEAAFMNASQLAEHLDVDPATVVRFAQRLGYPGYPELLDEVRSEVKDDLDRYINPPAFAKDPASVARAAIQREIDNLELLERSLNPKDVTKFVNLALKAKKIVVVGEGLSRELARLFRYHLTSLGFSVIDIDPDPTSVASAMCNLSRGDLVVGIAASPVCQDVAHTLRLADQSKINTVTIAGASSWPASLAAGLVLISPNVTAIRTPDYAALAALLLALYEALWVAQQDRQVRLDKKFNAMVADMADLRAEADYPKLPQIMT